MMITPSAAFGSGSISGIATSRKIPTTIAAMITASWERAPVASFTAEREFDDETGNPLENPLTRFALPSAVSSRLASISYPCRRANVLTVAIMSANAISANAAAGSSRSRNRWSPTDGHPNGGIPPLTSPTVAMS